MHEDVGDGGEVGADGVFDGVGDGVSLSHGEIGVYDDV
ncbi:MAG: hypothetical protein RIS92_1153 [Verrucomicrobiota bacterium]